MMPVPPAALTRLRRIRRRYTDVPFASVLALLGVNAGITALLRPELQPARQLAQPWDTVWLVMYSLGGLMILIGIGTRLANVEAAGCLAFGGGALIAAIATAVVIGTRGWNSTVILLLFCSAATTRAWHLVHGLVLVLVDTSKRVEL